jgi:hydrogenase 3 maturation protease
MSRMVIGVGNRLSRDDGAGPAVAQRLSDSDWMAVDCGTALENAVGLANRVSPDLLVIVDAARMGTPVGSVRRIAMGGNQQMLVTTHGLPLPFVLSRIQAAVGRVEVIGIEPEDLSWGEGLSSSVEDAVRCLVSMLRGGSLDSIPWA